MNIYYKIWADAILRFKKHNPNRKDWKWALFLLITWINALNFWMVLLWLKYFEIFDVPLLEISFLPGTLLDKFFAFAIEFALPFALINYFLIFHKKRYQRIIQNYRLSKQYALIYTMGIVLGAFISGILYGLVLS